MNQIKCSDIRVGMRFSRPVYFEDGVNMFVESGITIKPYHLVAITRWHIPFLLSDGRPLAEDEIFVDKDVVEDVDSLEDVTATEEFAEEMNEIWDNVEELN
ncbi:MAG: phosphohydrolase [Treponema sp.]|nr:phosphohydrolase [Treponema sp.]